MRPPIERFAACCRAPALETVVEPGAVPAVATGAGGRAEPADRAAARGAAVGRPARLDLIGAGSGYRVPIVLAGEPVECRRRGAFGADLPP